MKTYRSRRAVSGTKTFEGVQAHQADMGFFRGLLLGHHPTQGCDGRLVFAALLVETAQFDE
jgi:hypothetical protein